MRESFKVYEPISNGVLWCHDSFETRAEAEVCAKRIVLNHEASQVIIQRVVTERVATVVLDADQPNDVRIE